MQDSWQNFGVAITEPLTENGKVPPDSDVWIALVFLTIEKDNIELACALLAARQFGQRVQPSPKFGYKLTKPLYYAEHFDAIYRRNQTDLVAILKTLANDFPPENDVNSVQSLWDNCNTEAGRSRK